MTRAWRRLGQLLLGLPLFGFACALIIVAGIGVDPWSVFHQGLHRSIGLSIGSLTVITGVVVLLLWIPLRQRPGLGTVLNILLIGPFLDLGLWLIPPPAGLWQRAGCFALGLALLAIASGLYIGARHGAGPRDGLMTGLHSRLGWPIWLSRTSVEVTVLGVGWLLGGNVGAGTVLFALLIGPLCALTLPCFDVGPQPEPAGAASATSELERLS